MILIVDIDGVLADIVSGLIAKLGYPGRPAEYDLRKAYPYVNTDRIGDLIADPEFYDSLYPIPGSRECLNRLSVGWEIHYVTARPLAMSAVTARWLVQHGYPLGDLWVIGDESKPEFLLEKFGLDDYIVELSTRPLKSIGTDEMWEKAEGSPPIVNGAVGFYSLGVYTNPFGGYA